MPNLSQVLWPVTVDYTPQESAEGKHVCCDIKLWQPQTTIQLSNLQQGVITPIRTVLTAKTGVKKFWLSLLLFDHLTALQNGSWPFDHSGNQPMTVDCMHILSFDPIVYGRKQSNSTPFLSIQGQDAPS